MPLQSMNYFCWLGLAACVAGISLATDTKQAALKSPLAGEDQKRFDAGKDLYELTCLSCHQLDGRGQEALAPPLAGSQWVTNSPERLIRIVLHGMRGPVKVGDKVMEFPAEMPALFVLDDEQIAGLLTYIRRSWGHAASPVRPEAVKKVRDATADRIETWTEAELLKIM